MADKHTRNRTALAVAITLKIINYLYVSYVLRMIILSRRLLNQ